MGEYLPHPLCFVPAHDQKAGRIFLAIYDARLQADTVRKVYIERDDQHSFSGLGNGDVADLEFTRIVGHISFRGQAIIETRALDYGVAVI